PILVGVTFLFLLLINGTEGFPEPQEEPPIIKPIVLLFFVGVGIFCMIYGLIGIKRRRIWARWGAFLYMEYTGATAVWIGGGDCGGGRVGGGGGVDGVVF